MPALDSCHAQIVRAIQDDGWMVSPQPVQLATEERTVFVDVMASKQQNGGGQQILLAEI
jgi:hypothetical protein